MRAAIKKCALVADDAIKREDPKNLTMDDTDCVDVFVANLARFIEIADLNP